MNLGTKIICRTTGAIGMGMVLYDSVRVGKHYSKIESEKQSSKYLENAYFSSRTSDNMSYTSNAMRDKVFEMRSKNPLPALYGKIKGGTKGFLQTLGDNLITTCCASFALLSKGKMAKFGAIGTVLATIYKVARDGFGLGKQNPMD